MSEVEKPTLETDFWPYFRQGCPNECRRILAISSHYYPDLLKEIRETMQQIFENLEWVKDKDPVFAKKVDDTCRFPELISCRHTYEDILRKVHRMQISLRSKKRTLSEEEIQRIWEPIASSYEKIVKVLKERVLPPEKRQMLEVGDVITIPVLVYLDRYKQICLETKMDAFSYVIWHPAGFINPVRELTFTESYLDEIPQKLRWALHALYQNKIAELPFEITGFDDYEDETFAKINEELFWQNVPG